MPFDGTENTRAQGKINRARLIEALRSPMPETHTWDFGTVYRETMRLDRDGKVAGCGTIGCAIGLAMAIGLPVAANLYDAQDGDEYRACLRRLAEVFALTPLYAERTFLSATHYGRNFKEVTPAMVADSLEGIGAMCDTLSDAWLAERVAACR